MFEDIKEILKKAKRLDDKKAFRFAVTDKVKDLIIELNTENQLGEKGVDSDGVDLGDYAPFTIDERLKLGLQVDHIDFKVTGKYWKSWKVKVVKDEIIISVNQNRYDELVNELRFSDEHVGLTDENLGKVSDEMVENYIEFTLKNVGLL